LRLRKKYQALRLNTAQTQIEILRIRIGKVFFNDKILIIYKEKEKHMKRVGVAASKIAKGNLVLYNFYVVLISSLFSLFIFIVAGSTVIFALLIIYFICNEIIPVDFSKNWTVIIIICMATLTIVTAGFNLFIISKNIKFSVKKWMLPDKKHK
jgi:hypothetical protein